MRSLCDTLLETPHKDAELELSWRLHDGAHTFSTTTLFACVYTQTPTPTWHLLEKNRRDFGDCNQSSFTGTVLLLQCFSKFVFRIDPTERPAAPDT